MTLPFFEHFSNELRIAGISEFDCFISDTFGYFKIYNHPLKDRAVKLIVNPNESFIRATVRDFDRINHNEFYFVNQVEAFLKIDHKFYKLSKK